MADGHYYLCTGKRDRNGQLLYDGDVAQLYQQPDTVFMVQYDRQKACFVVPYAVQWVFRYNPKQLERIGHRTSIDWKSLFPTPKFYHYHNEHE